MPYTELDKTWRATSTVATSTRVNGAGVQEWTIHAVTPAGSTATIEVHAFQSTESTAVGTKMGSSQVLASSAAGEGVVIQFTGPIGGLAPRIVSMTSTGTVVVRVLGI